MLNNFQRESGGTTIVTAVTSAVVSAVVSYTAGLVINKIGETIKNRGKKQKYHTIKVRQL